MIYSIIIDSNGNGIGSHAYVEEPTSYPSNEVPCTQAQAQNPSLYQVVNGQIIESLQAAQSAQITLLRAACASAITGGFTSSALGSTYTYASDLISQANLNSVANNPSGGYLWCESGGVWSFKVHTQAEAQSVLGAFVAWLNACQSQLATLTGEVNAATTVSGVQAITWTNPA